ncbi:MAG TPA: AMP-binding protein [Bacillota bacterium]|nr:AMP-binding protein [Bacillota bacterium]
MEWLLVVLRWIFRCLFRVQVRGLEKLDFSKPMILMPNHTSLLDAVLLALFLPKNVIFVANTGIAYRFSWMMRARSHITIDPLNPYSIRQMVRIINQNSPLVLFPEGRITTTGTLMKIYSGIGFLALRTGAQVYPVILRGLERSKFSYMGDKNKTIWFPKVQLTVGSPFILERDAARSLRAEKKRATDHIYQILQNESLNVRLKNEVNLYNELLEAACIHGSKRVIVEDPSQSLTYRGLLLASTVLGHKFKERFGGFDTVGVLLPNATAHVVTLFALFRIGIRPAILNFSLGSRTIIECCETAVIRTVITSRVFVEKGNLSELMDRFSEENVQVIYLEDVKMEVSVWDKWSGLTRSGQRSTARNGEVILFTSGSESKPKGVILTHRNLYSNVEQVLCSIGITSKDKIFNALPMFHSFGLTAGTFLPILSGVATYLYPTPLHYKAIPELCYDTNATVLFGTSTFLAGYGRFAHPYDFYSLRYVFAGAEKLKDEVRELWLGKFGIRIMEGYGATETSPILALNTPLAYKKGTVGCLVPGIRSKIEPVAGIENGGRLLVQGPNVMKGYLIHGKGFVPADEWYDTGDVVEQDEEGFVTILSRLKRFAKVGGEMISLGQVEELATICFGHIDVAAVAVTDPRKGERILLYTAQAGDQLDKFRSFLAQHAYSPMLCPYRMDRVNSLPLLGSGKIDYVSLKQMAETAVGKGV